ncbi:MAG: class I SAM-dependent methyltransferase [Chloroflexi bacterium]|nr:class I SAM-dependent methyltransferase [Chloroflexota bacterium]
MVVDPAGAVAPDGSPVELYLRLPSFGEPEIVHGAIRPGASILELGCGVGRMTHELVRLGHPVTAVDESPEMLAHVRDAETLRARIEDLDLEREFGCVLLASHFVNTADSDERRRLLDVCARHLAPDGLAVIEAYAEDWHPVAGDVAGGEDLQIRYLRADWEGSVVTAEIEYRIGSRRWAQGPFTAEVLGEAGLAASLEAAGLTFDEWLDDRHTWLAARRAA